MLCRNCSRSASINREVNQLIADHGVGSSIDNRDVASSGVRSMDCDFHVDGLACCVRLYVGGVILVFVAFAEPEFASGGVVIGLGGADLEFGLDVAVGV